MYFYFLFQLGNRTILRIVLHGLGSPLWGNEHYRPDTINPSLTQFLFQLRAVMRSALAVCLITIPTHLFQVRGLRRFKYYKLLCLIIPLYLKTFNSLSYRNVKKKCFSFRPLSFFNCRFSLFFYVSCFSFCNHFQEPALIRRVQRLCDTVIKLESFVGSEMETNPVYKDYHGNFYNNCIVKLNCKTGQICCVMCCCLFSLATRLFPRFQINMNFSEL